MKEDIAEIIISEQELQRAVKKLAIQISNDYQGRQPLLIGVLKGSVVFLADLIRHIDLPLEIDFLGITSYGSSAKSSGVVKITKDCRIDLSGKDVILVEDIIDTGNSVEYILELLHQKGAKSLKLCVLLDKAEAHTKDIKVDYRGLMVPNEFLVGYGLDYNEKYRNLPYIGILKKEVYENKSR
jgi:hypoxanthine phosphoribosyltransferase